MLNSDDAGEDPKRNHFWNRAGRKLHALLSNFRAFVDRYRWLAIFYKITVATIGTLIIIAGIAMLVLPGPGWLTIFFGFAILGTEFVWARRVVQWLRARVESVIDRWRRYREVKKQDRKQGSNGREND